MTAERKKLILVWVVAVTTLLASGPTITFAQKSSGGVTGEARLHPGTWGNQRSSRSIRHARDYSRGMYRYSRDAERITPHVAKAESEELGRNIAKAQKEMTVARQEVGDDAEASAKLKTVEKHLATAAEHHKMLHEECCKDTVDGAVCMKHCIQILLELDKAQAEQDALIRGMEMKAHPAHGASQPRTQQR